MILKKHLSRASVFLSAFAFSTQDKDFRWCLQLQRERTVLWTWTVRPEICSVLKMLIQPVQVELEFWQSKGTIWVCKVIFVCAISIQFFFFLQRLFTCSKCKHKQGVLWNFFVDILSSWFSLYVAILLVFPRLGLPKGFSANIAKEWIDKRRLSIRPWASFVDQRKFSKPRNFGVMCQRVVKNVEIYNSNYTFIFLGLILYCM